MKTSPEHTPSIAGIWAWTLDNEADKTISHACKLHNTTIIYLLYLTTDNHFLVLPKICIKSCYETGPEHTPSIVGVWAWALASGQEMQTKDNQSVRFNQNAERKLLVIGLINLITAIICEVVWNWLLF